MNNNGTLHLKTEAFTAEDASVSEMLIRLSANRLSYAVIDSTTRMPRVLFDTVLVKPLEEVIDSLCSQHAYLKFPFSSVKLSVESLNFSLIPAELYKQEDLGKLASFVQTTVPSRFALHQFSKQEFYALANVAEKHVRSIEQCFGKVAVYHQVVPFLSYLFTREKCGSILYLQFNGNTFEAALMVDGQLQFYNVFEIPTTDDFHFYLLKIMKELSLSELNTEVQVCGEIEKFSELYRRLTKYFKVSIMDSSDTFRYADKFRLVPTHQFIGLLGLSLCE